MGPLFAEIPSHAWVPLFLRITPEDGYGVQGSGLTPPSQPNPSTPGGGGELGGNHSTKHF